MLGMVPSVLAVILLQLACVDVESANVRLYTWLCAKIQLMAPAVKGIGVVTVVDLPHMVIVNY
jgi:hypothetical protein